MTTIAQAHGSRARSAKPRRETPIQDYDLPVLAAMESPRVQLDWESMLEEGASPAILLGAERRLRGPR